ncbi:MAG: cache domain-containing protein, partial [Candidatus Binatia bacterium]
AKGDLICSARPVKQAQNISDRDYFQRAVHGGDFAVGEYEIGRVSGKASLNLASPIFDQTGEVDGIVFAGLDLASFNHILAAAQLPRNSTLTVIDRRGTILARQPDAENWIGKSVPDNEMFKNVLAKSEGVTEGVGFDGKKHLYGLTSVGEWSHKGDLHIALGLPSELDLAGADWQLTRNLAALIFVGILALAAAWFGSDILVLRHLNALVATTAKIGGGDLGARTGLPHSRSEIGRLAASFDKMAEILELQRVEASHAQQTIQQNLERTRSLHEIDAAIASTLDLRKMLAVLLEKIDLVLPDGVTTVRLINDDTGDLEPVACRNIDEDVWRARNLRSVQGLAEIVLTTKKPLTVANIQADPRNTAHQFARKFGLVSYHGVPLVAKNELLGVIAFYTKEGHSFSYEELEFLTTIAGQSAIAIHNSKLYEAAKRSEDEISALNALTI